MNIGEPFNPFRRFKGIFIPEQIVRLPDLSQGAKICYGRLLRYAGKDGNCYPSVEKLAVEIGVGERQTQNYLAELQRERMIRKMVRPGRSDLIDFLWHEAFVPYSQGVNDDSRPEVKGPSARVNDSSPRGRTMVHPKRVREVNHHQESQFEESHPLDRRSGGFGETPSSEGPNVVPPPILSGPGEGYSSPEEELIALVRGKGHELTRDVLRRVREYLELRGVTLPQFLDLVRSPFENNLLDPPGFLLSRAKNPRLLFEAAVPPDPPPPPKCGNCGEGREVIREGDSFGPCPACTTASFRAEFFEKETKRTEYIRQRKSSREGADQDGGEKGRPS